MKRIGTLLLVLLLVMGMITGTALADSWYCSKCKIYISSNYCPNCGSAKPVTSSSQTLQNLLNGSTISNVRCSLQNNGDVVVRWDSTSSGPYTIKYTTDKWLRYYNGDQSSYYGKTATLRYLIPGLTYTITVSNGSKSASTTYYVPKYYYTEFPTDNRVKLAQTSYSLSDVTYNPGKTVEVRTYYPQLKYDREYSAKLVLKTPYGYAGCVRHWDSYTLENKYTYKYSTFSLYNDFLSYVKNDFGSIPTGTYTFELYFDGKLYDSVNFRLGY